MTMETFDVHGFVEQQLAVWPEVRERYAALDNVERKHFVFDGYRIEVQHNPARINSTGAKIDKRAIAARPCFLCSSNRPLKQLAQHYGNYEILVNPFPIFRHHLTIALQRHEPQRLIGHVGDMCRLSRLLPGMVVFFNGAQCGASAPDHMHFQAGDRSDWPIFDDYCAKQEYAVAQGIMTADGIGRRVYRIETSDEQDVERRVTKLLEMQNISEAMTNVLVTNDAQNVNIYIIPRKAFRPWQYNKILKISPASVEVGGVFIAPVSEHFAKITSADVEDILRQVCFQ